MSAGAQSAGALDRPAGGFLSTFATVERLVARIVAGEAVFFVGSGFSLDSEPNGSGRLIRRLLIRFAAITDVLATRPGVADRARRSAEALQDGLRVTFGLGAAKLSPREMVADTAVDKLTQVYYNINDWMCSAYTILLRELEGVDAACLRAVRRIESQLLKKDAATGAVYDEVPLQDFDVKALLELGESAGKALFLDTMGFADPRVWHGRPRATHRRAALDSYGTRIRDRQLVIARLAREGLAPLILTTNFDLLLEGAGVSAGFEVGDVRATDPVKPAAAYDRLLVVGGPTEFFNRGTAYRAALLLKIHGCVYGYRVARRQANSLLRYLPSMVFTFREIQNWRKDSWSRDLVSTLLRTRSIVLCGYSGADPVVHDTFRTVYEEISATRLPARGGASMRQGASTDNRAFFTGRVGKAEFAGLEILRAASRAAGFADPPLFGHGNYMPVHFKAARGEDQKFPTMDELFVWVYHRTLRRLQLNAIRSDLGRIAVTVLRHNVAPADLREIEAAFVRLYRDENLAARKWTDSGGSRDAFRRITAWTHHFHAALLREFALMEVVTRNQRSGLRIQEFRSSGCYFALQDRPGWGAWGALVEIALRGMAGLQHGCAAAAAESTYPIALVTRGPSEYTKTAIVLRGPGADRLAPGDIPGAYRRIHEWQMMPWVRDQPPAPGTPQPEDLWQWALQGGEHAEIAAAAWFGGTDATPHQSVPAGS